jgi:molecular chaperone GrpE
MPDDTPEPIPVDAADELGAVRAKLEATERELNNYKLRMADFENARKRLLRDAETDRKYAVEPLARELLGALDNLDRALDAARRAGDSGPLAAGVAATATQFLEVFKRYGVKRIDCEPGTKFDPNLHEAVSQQPAGEYTSGEVVQVLLPGFMLHDRVLRPTSVVVAE